MIPAISSFHQDVISRLGQQLQEIQSARKALALRSLYGLDQEQAFQPPVANPPPFVSTPAPSVPPFVQHPSPPPPSFVTSIAPTRVNRGHLSQSADLINQQGLLWSGRYFTSAQQFSDFLRQLGHSWARWAQLHPVAARALSARSNPNRAI